MNFLNPILFGVGLACVAIPILIHILMRRRRRPVAWGAMMFLLEAYRRQRRRMNLEQLLLLGARCLLVALLAAALGKPVLGAAGLLGAARARTLYLVLDNSLTSTARDASGKTASLEASRQAALELLATLDASKGDRAALVTLAGPAEAAAVPATPDLASVAELVRGVRAADSRADFQGALGRLRDELSRARDAGDRSAPVVALLSSWRAGAADTGATLPGLGGLGEAPQVLVLPPETAPLDNVSIVDVQPLRRVLLVGAADKGGVQAQFRVTLQRSGAGAGVAGSSRVWLSAGRAGEAEPPRTQASVAWAAGQARATTVVSVDLAAASLAGGRLIAQATLERDAIDADNVFRRPIDTRERLQVALLAAPGLGTASTLASYGASDWLALAIAPEADVLVRRRQQGELRLEAVDAARAGSGEGAVLRDCDAVVIPQPDLLDSAGWSAVRGAADRGALVLVFPPAEVQTHLWPDAMNAALGLDVTIGREATALAAPARLTVGHGAEELLAPIAAELPDLASPVSVTRLLPMRGGAGALDPILSLEDGTPILAAASARAGSAAPGGLVVLAAVAPDTRWTDLPARPLMLPLVQELIRQGVGRSGGGGTCSAGLSPALANGAVELARTGGAADAPGPSIVPVIQGRLAQPVRDSGAYLVRSASGVSSGVICFNADAAGGNVEARTREEVAAWLSPMAAEVRWIGSDVPAGAGGSGGRSKQELPPISMPLLWAAAAVALGEAFLARVCSHATAEAAAGGRA